jgi:sentrin-specific protease 7
LNQICVSGLLFIYYKIDIRIEDFKKLKPGIFLNDKIIDFYLQYLLHEILEAEDRKGTHIFSSFFYQQLTAKASSSRLADKADQRLSEAEECHARVKNWTRAQCYKTFTSVIYKCL